MHLSPVQCARRAFGSATKLARAAGLDRGNVYRWARPRIRGGCGGDLPNIDTVRIILIVARRAGVTITADELINGRDC